MSPPPPSDRSEGVASIGARAESVITAPDAQADLELMAAAAENDPAAQRAVAHRLAPRVRKVAGLLCRTAADADDATQLALLEILKSAGSFRVATSLERWAERLTIRTTLRAARRERSRKGLLERWISEDTLPWGASAIEQPSEAVSLDALLKHLSDDRYQVFVLHHALDYTVTEIAELTGVATGTVKDRLVMARKQLRKVLVAEDRAAGEKLR